MHICAGLLICLATLSPRLSPSQLELRDLWPVRYLALSQRVFLGFARAVEKIEWTELVCTVWTVFVCLGVCICVSFAVWMCMGAQEVLCHSDNLWFLSTREKLNYLPSMRYKPPVCFDPSVSVYGLWLGWRLLDGKAVHISGQRGSADSFILVLVPLLSFSEVPSEQQHATLELLR